MEATNHERVGVALRLLSKGLTPFVEREARAKWGDEWLHHLTEAAAGASGGPARTSDPSFLLRAMSGSWHLVFRNGLGHAERSYVSEIREFRNRWAHQDSLSDDDAERALDSIRRLLLAVSSMDEAREVDAMRQDLRRAQVAEHLQQDVGPSARNRMDPPPSERARATDRGVPTEGGSRPRPDRNTQPRSSTGKPRRDGTRWELWEDEAIADLYIEHGPNGGGSARREELATRMERTPAQS